MPNRICEVSVKVLNARILFESVLHESRCFYIMVKVCCIIFRSCCLMHSGVTEVREEVM